jgi:ABC-2 type transport system permease protein
MMQLVRVVRAFPTLLRVGFAEAVAYRAEFVVWVLAYSMPLVMLALWTAVAREAPIGNYGEREFQAYFVATLMVRLSTGSWVVWDMNMEVRQGTLQKRLLRPIHPLLTYLAENMAALPMRLLVVVPIFIGFLSWLGPEAFSAEALQLALIPLSLLGAFLLNFLSMAVIGSMALFWESSIALFDLWLGLYTVLSGYVMPLSLFPPWAARVNDFLPFRLMLSFPVENMLGQMSPEASLRALLLQWSYVLLLSVCVTLVFRAGVKRFAAFGG